ncbi:hypothetical protein THAOC_20603, partial [Thalassiosira oceanica]
MMNRGIDRENFMKELGRLDHDVGEGLGGLRNEHLTALLFSPRRDVTPGAAAAADDLYAFADNVVQCRLPDYFYVGYVATRLVPANKVDPSTLALGASPDARPINVGNVLRRLIPAHSSMMAYWLRSMRLSRRSRMELASRLFLRPGPRPQASDCGYKVTFSHTVLEDTSRQAPHGFLQDALVAPL